MTRPGPAVRCRAVWQGVTDVDALTGEVAGRASRRRIDLPASYDDVYAKYQVELDRVFDNPHTRRAYASRVRGYLAWLDSSDTDGGDPLGDPHARDYAVRDYKAYLKTVAKRKPTTINMTLAALDHFYTHLGLGPVVVRREELSAVGPRALDAERGEQKRFLRAVERLSSARDRAAATLLYYSGLRIGELVALDVDDVPISARKGMVIVRSGKRGRYREVPLHVDARVAIRAWLDARPANPGADQTPALLLNLRGDRLSTRSVDDLIDRIAEDAKLPELTPHVLRHTFATNLLRGGSDIVIVAELMGHSRLDTTRRYTLPTDADRRRAVDALPTDH